MLKDGVTGRLEVQVTFSAIRNSLVCSQVVTILLYELFKK